MASASAKEEMEVEAVAVASTSAGGQDEAVAGPSGEGKYEVLELSEDEMDIDELKKIRESEEQELWKSMSKLGYKGGKTLRELVAASLFAEDFPHPPGPEEQGIKEEFERQVHRVLSSLSSFVEYMQWFKPPYVAI